MNNEKPNLLKFFLDPEWHFVMEMLSRNTEPLRDIATIDISQSAETIKAIIAGRQETLKLVDNFKQDVETYSTTITKSTTTFQ
jgi:hypothetical protein